MFEYVSSDGRERDTLLLPSSSATRWSNFRSRWAALLGGAADPTDCLLLATDASAVAGVRRSVSKFLSTIVIMRSIVMRVSRLL